MRPGTRIAAWALLIAALPGCRSARLASDQDHIRASVMDLHTNQIMDNLIRHRRGLPILQLDYIHMTGTVTDTTSGSVGGSQTLGWSRTLAPAASAGAARTFSNLFNWSVMGQQVNQLTVTAEPVTSSPNVYKAYDKFMRDPSHLLETADPPPPGAALLVRSVAPCGGPACGHWRHHPEVFYWVPCAFKDDFFQLALHTVADRSQDPDGDDNAFPVRIRSYHPEDVRPTLGTTASYRVRFEVTPAIPNDNGSLVVPVGADGRETLAPDLLEVELDESKPVAGLGSADMVKATNFTLSFNAEALRLDGDDAVRAFLDGLKNDNRLKIRLRTIVPTDLGRRDPAEDQRHQQELIRLQQQIPTQPLR